MLPDSFVEELSSLVKQADAVLTNASHYNRTPASPVVSSKAGKVSLKPSTKGTNFSLTNASPPATASGVAASTKSMPPPMIRT